MRSISIKEGSLEHRYLAEMVAVSVPRPEATVAVIQNGQFAGREGDLADASEPMEPVRR